MRVSPLGGGAFKSNPVLSSDLHKYIPTVIYTYIIFFETGAHCCSSGCLGTYSIEQVGLELFWVLHKVVLAILKSVRTRVASNSDVACLCHSTAEIKGMSHHHLAFILFEIGSHYIVLPLPPRQC